MMPYHGGMAVYHCLVYNTHCSSIVVIVHSGSRKEGASNFVLRSKKKKNYVGKLKKVFGTWW